VCGKRDLIMWEKGPVRRHLAVYGTDERRMKQKKGGGGCAPPFVLLFLSFAIYIDLFCHINRSLLPYE
jgi:hypothetical protein